MRLNPNDLRCAACDAAIHPFVRACPACGEACASLLPEIRESPDASAGALIADASVLDNVHMVANFYRLRQGGAPDGLSLRDGVQIVLDIVTYQVDGDGPPVSNAAVALDGDDLVVVDVSRGRARAVTRTRIPLWSILAASAATDRISIHRAGGPPVTIHNRRGITASRPRPNHYHGLEGWLALLDAEAAERRWRAIGVDAHAAELGIAVTDPADAPAKAASAPAKAASAPSEAASAPARTASNAEAERAAAAPGVSVADSLRALDALRADRLVSDAEYDAKRREILARL